MLLAKDSNGILYYNNKPLEEMFPEELWDCPEAFNSAHIHGYEPMTAKELETEAEQEEALVNPNNFIEEKFDGTRALVYFLKQTDINGNDIGYCRVFSRRTSKKTGFYVENSDNVPQIRNINCPELDETILDGEMFINGRPFKDVSSTMNCKWDKAVDRQIELGCISLHAFDILFYKGIDLRKMPLYRRKVYLHLAIEEANNPFIEEVVYQSCGQNVSTLSYEATHGDLTEVFNSMKDNSSAYPCFYSEIKQFGNQHSLSPKAFYEYIVATGGEGVIIKPKTGKYNHKRGWEYSKIKKFLTREMIIVGFSDPTREYTGKDIKKWMYWENNDTNTCVIGNFFGNKHYTPVTKFYYNHQVGNLLLGVLISRDYYEALPKNKQGRVVTPSSVNVKGGVFDYVMEVCECSGFDDETREYFTNHQEELLGSVVEVKANEIMRDSGRLRHPRYLRMRNDKSPEQCIWEDHVM